MAIKSNIPMASKDVKHIFHCLDKILDYKNPKTPLMVFFEEVDKIHQIEAIFNK